MLKKLKHFFTKSYNSVNERVSFFWWYFNKNEIWDNEYISFFIWWQYAAITAIAESIAWLWYRLANWKDKEISHEYLEYITPELLQNITIFMKITWTAYVLKIMSEWSKKILWLSILLPWYLNPLVDNNWFLTWRRYSQNWNSIILKPEEVLVFAEFNPNQRYPYITRWYSPLQALAMTIRGEKEIETWNYSLLKNDVPPGMILTTDQSMSADQVETIKKAREKNHTWAENVWKLAILPFWIKPSSFQPSPKEMEFISQQERDRDKILAIYKVPKAVLWIWEWVNVGNVKAFNQIFASRCIDPLAKKIARVFNDWLFNWIWVFEFINILPTDEEEVRQHYLSWWITKNEYRIELWYKPVGWWDVFYNWDIAKVENEIPKKEFKDFYKNVNFKTIVKTNTPRTEERMQKRWERKQKKYVEYEKDLKEWLLCIFNKQEEDVLKLYDKMSWTKNLKMSFDDLLEKYHKYHALYHANLKKRIAKIIKEQWERAMSELNVSTSFMEATDEIKNKTSKMITHLATSVDDVTSEKLKETIYRGVNEWLTPIEVRNLLLDVFKELKTSRAEKIVRTETIRYWTFAEQEAWRQSWVVSKKQWRTALDERVCERCWVMHGKVVWLNENFFRKWDDFNWLALDYEDVGGSPLHPNCRCDMIPIV